MKAHVSSDQYRYPARRSFQHARNGKSAYMVKNTDQNNYYKEADEEGGVFGKRDTQSRRRQERTSPVGWRRNGVTSVRTLQDESSCRDNHMVHRQQQQQQLYEQQQEIKRLQKTVEALERRLAEKSIELDVAQDRLDSQTGLIYYLQQQLLSQPNFEVVPKEDEAVEPRSCLKLPSYFASSRDHKMEEKRQNVEKRHEHCLRYPTAFMCQSQATRSTARLGSLESSFTSFEFHDASCSNSSTSPGWTAEAPLLQRGDKPSWKLLEP